MPLLTSTSVVDPDWIQIQWGPWIRIRIRNPDQYGAKMTHKIEKS